MINGQLTETELAYTRRDGQVSLYYLVFLDTPAVFAARVNQAFSSKDKIWRVIFDGVTLGAYTDILAGMTCWVGSTPGAYDIGQVRVRSATSTILTIGETSDVDWADNLYLTVVDDFGLWVKNPYLGNMDRDIVYSDQHANMLPMPMLGTDQVARLTGADVGVAFDGSASFCPGSTITGHAWSAPGAVSASGMSTATPTIVYDAIGTYRVAYTVTAANGKSETAYRKVFIWDVAHPPLVWDPSEQVASDFVFTAFPQGSYQRGGWNFGMQMFSQAGIDQVRDRQKVIVFARDFYDGTEISIGPLAGCENVVAWGWIMGESISLSPGRSSVTFDVQGPAAWLDMMDGPSLSLENVSGTPTKWTQIQALTVDKALAHTLTWRTTAPLCMDCYLTGDTRTAANFNAAIGSIWQQINMIAGRILAKAGCDHYGRLWVQVEAQYLPETERDDIPTVLEITKNDRRGINLGRQPSSSVGSVQISGLNGTATLYSMSGHISKRFGRRDPVRDGFLAASQSQLNKMCGLIMGRANNPYPDIEIQMASIQRAVDVFPRQYVTAPVDAGDSPRGVAFTGRVAPMEISYRRTSRGVWLPTIHGEAESFAALVINGDIPDSPVLPDEPGDVDDGIYDPPIWPPPPPVLTISSVYLHLYGYGIWYTTTLNDESPQWLSKNNGAPEDTGELRFFEIDKLAGKLYVGGIHGLWWGTLGNPDVTQFIDQAWLNDQFGFGGVSNGDGLANVIGAIGINQSTGNNLIVLAGSGYLGDRVGYVYLGSNLGLTRKAEVIWDGIDFGYGNITYGGGQWLATTGAPTSGNYWGRYPLLATTIDAEGGGFGNETEPLKVGYWHVRAGAGGLVYARHYIGGATNIAKIYYSADNLLTGVLRDFQPLIPPACSPTGQFLMCTGAVGGGEGLKRSTDYGTTWGTVPNFPPDWLDDVTATAIASIDADRWIVAGHDAGFPYAPRVFCTEDFGETWVDKTGNLPTYIPNSGSGVRKVIVL